MSDTQLGNKGRIVLLGSVAFNIFLIAFLLGRLSMPGLLPPPPPFVHMPAPMMCGEMPPPFAGMPQGRMRGDMPAPPPPFFSPADLFTAEEMKQDFAIMQQHFKKMKTLRQDFAKQLEHGQVSKEEVLKHFTEVDQLMADVKKKMQEKAATKISTMSLEDRKRFAERLLEAH